MVGSGVRPDPAIAGGFGMMTKAEMEEAIRNVDRRLVSVEQILPTLATRADVAEARLRADIQFESVRDDIRKVAETVASLVVKFDRMDERFDRMDERFDHMDERFDRMDRRFDRLDQRFDRLEARVDTVERGIGAITTRVDDLTGRLTSKGVI
jgi:phage shock protein A